MTIPFPREFRLHLRLATGCALAFMALGALPAAATQTVSIGEVEVGSSGEVAYADAMRAALVRVTGRRSAASDPAFAPLIQDARRYVQIFRPAAGGASARVTLDAAAIERAVAQLGQPVWSRERPVVLGVITSVPAGAEAGTVRSRLERAAIDRGLPLRFAAAAGAVLAEGAAASPEAALLAARRAGADVALVGEADGDDWQWTLFDGATATVFHGDVTAGIEGAADTLALGSQAAVAQPLSSTEFRIRGIRALKDYADVQKILESQPAIRSAELIAADDEGAWFRVEVAGGPAGLAEALASQPRLRREGGDDPPRYRYLP
jgi:hypothetical protein